MKQKLIRVFPHGYSNNQIKELNDLLIDGWLVVNITIMVFNDRQSQHSDYILQKQLDE
jgi:hypothetical protein